MVVPRVLRTLPNLTGRQRLRSSLQHLRRGARCCRRCRCRRCCCKQPPWCPAPASLRSARRQVSTHTHTNTPHTNAPAIIRCAHSQAFVEFNPHAIPPGGGHDDDDDDDDDYDDEYDDDEYYDERGEELMDPHTLNELFFNYHFFGSRAEAHAVAQPASPGASEASIEALYMPTTAAPET